MKNAHSDVLIVQQYWFLFLRCICWFLINNLFFDEAKNKYSIMLIWNYISEEKERRDRLCGRDVEKQ